MINPWYTYIAVFCISFIAYTFSWSFLYPAVSTGISLFFAGSFLLNFLIGSSQKEKFVYKQASHDKTVEYATQLICFLWSLEFAYHGGIPLVKVLSGIYYDYISFGIPTLSVFTFTFTSFVCVYSFHLYLSTKSKKYLLFWLINLSPGIMIVSRGTFLMNLISCVFVYLIKRFSYKRSTEFFSEKKNIRTSAVTSLFCAALLILFILFSFGYVGNIRNASAFNMDRDQSDDLILQMGGATEDFIASPIPKEFFWSYLYVSSPLANLQYNIDYFQSKSINVFDLPFLVIDTFTPDFIAKRINESIGRSNAAPVLITPELTVPTVYAKSFVDFSWIGMLIMAMVMLIFPSKYLELIRKESPFYITGMAILNTMYFFMIFDNMFTFAGIFMQLLYPIILRKHIVKNY